VVRLAADMEPEDIDVEQAVRDIVNFFSARAAEKNVRFAINIIEPPGSVRANRKLFNQVVLNLVSNAFRYSDPGRDVVITLGVTQGDWATLTVQNWGLLIPEQDYGNIFKEFWRGNDARKYVGRGTGLGLSIVKNIIDFRGGNIRVSSDPANGTRFTVEIPRRRKGGTQNGKE
jgi:signal transduction histidine kinase